MCFVIFNILAAIFFLTLSHCNAQKLTTRLIEATSLSSAAGGINEEMKAFPFKKPVPLGASGAHWEEGRWLNISKQCMCLSVSVSSRH